MAQPHQSDLSKIFIVRDVLPVIMTFSKHRHTKYPTCDLGNENILGRNAQCIQKNSKGKVPKYQSSSIYNFIVSALKSLPVTEEST